MGAAYALVAACRAVLAVGLASAVGCGEEYIPLRLLTEEPVVVGISLSVTRDGPYAQDLAPLPADRPRAEVLPLDEVELDALVVDADGPRDLADATWVLCGGDFLSGGGCLSSMQQQGERYGGLVPCTEGSASTAFACEAGRGVRPRVVMPAFTPETPGFSVRRGADLFLRAAVIAGSPGGPTTEACVQQLVNGPRVDLRGCAIGVKELPYGPEWTLQPVLIELGLLEPNELFSMLPALVSQLLPPNAAPRIDEVRIGAPEDFVFGQPDVDLELHSVHEPLEIEAGTRVGFEPVVPLRDQQIELRPAGPDSWVGVREHFTYSIWADAPIWGGFDPGAVIRTEEFVIEAPEDEGPIHVYVLVTDSGEAISWFTLELQVVSR